MWLDEVSKAGENGFLQSNTVVSTSDALYGEGTSLS